MLGFLIKSALVIGSCSSIAVISTVWSKPEKTDSPNKINFTNQKRTIEDITRLEDIDVWGKENGCNFIFVKDWGKTEIYTAQEYVNADGGKEKKVGGWKTASEERKLEQAMVNAVKKYKDFCGNKLKTFTLVWSPAWGDFYINDPNKHKEIERRGRMATINKLMNPEDSKPIRK